MDIEASPIAARIVEFLLEQRVPEDHANIHLFQALALYPRVAAAAIDQHLPQARWPKHRVDDESPEAFLRRVWGDLIEARKVSRSDLLRADEKLYKAWFNWLRTHSEPRDLRLLRRSELRAETFRSCGPATHQAYKGAIAFTNHFRRMTKQSDDQLVAGG